MISTGKKKILFGCMDWGIGHATRSVSLVRKFLAEGHEVILASAGTTADFLKNYFPQLKIIAKPAYSVHYSKHIPLPLALLFQLPAFLKTIDDEKKWTEKIIGDFGITGIVSDNCYGLRNDKVSSSLITHQLMVKCPPLLMPAEKMLHRQILKWLEPFNECIIPDYAGEDNLSGDLSHKFPLPPNAHFAGPLSRFQKSGIAGTPAQYEYCFLISGPEPSRKILEKKAIRFLENKTSMSVIIRGLPGANDTLNEENICFYNHVTDEQMETLLFDSKKIICRSGYSTIMDLHALNKSALLIPTPGQTEQEYLAGYLSAKNKFQYVREKDFF